MQIVSSPSTIISPPLSPEEIGKLEIEKLETEKSDTRYIGNASFPSPKTAENLSKTAILQEVFSSVQGEGVYVGKRQIFVRFAHCHLKCAYCDTPMSTVDGQCHVEEKPGQPQRTLYANPMDINTLSTILQDLLTQAKHHSISFTGGEPLLYHAFLKSLIPKIRPLASIYLETSGTQPEFLAEVLPWLDIIAMDIKLPSSTGFPLPLEKHTQFYAIARQNPQIECFIKLIFNQKTTAEELLAVQQIVTQPDTPIILQPETSLLDQSVTIDPQHLLMLENTLSQHFTDVRVIPQTHKMLNVL